MRVHRRVARIAVVLGAAFLWLPCFAHAAAPPAQDIDWLPLCGKCLKPTIFSKSGIGTAHAAVKARVTYQNAREHCEQWSMEDHPDCDKQARETLQEEKGKIYTATADCIHGKITLATGDSLTYTGIWPSGYLKGKTRWQFVVPGNAKPELADENGPVNGFMVDATSRILCPSGIGAVRKR